MIDEPDPDVLLEAMGRCLAGPIAAELTGTARYHTLVVANLCSILARQWRLGSGQRSAAVDELKALIGYAPVPAEDRTEGDGGVNGAHRARLADLVAALDERLRRDSGGLGRDTVIEGLESIATVDPGNDSVFAVLRADVDRRLAINRPGYGVDYGATGHSGPAGTATR